ncbi:MAG: YesL family protein [Oscillospiraceae bacterium]|jgi:uncharacterized membrane protein YesL|nr:YesL family protein [Oscillospiraceae bacterium]
MAFLGFGKGYAKEGPGVKKNAPQKRGFIRFFEIYFRKFGGIIKANLMFVLFSLPVVTAGASWAALTFVMREYAKEQHSFIFSDFWEHFRKNWKQAFPAGLAGLAISLITGFSLYFYWLNSGLGTYMYILLGLSLMIGVIFLFASYYVYLMIITLDLKLGAIFKNAMIFSIAGLKQNVFVILGTALALAVPLGLMYFYDISIGILVLLLLYALLLPATLCFLICFNCYPVIEKYCIDPYYEAHPEEDRRGRGTDTDTLFSDEFVIKDSKGNRL